LGPFSLLFSDYMTRRRAGFMQKKRHDGKKKGSSGWIVDSSLDWSY
jgi:hypothetical protein